MVHNLYSSKDGTIKWDVSLNAIKTALADQEGLLWVSLEQPSEEEIQNYLVDVFQFHPLAVEDCQSTGFQTPKVDDYGDYLFMIMLALLPDDNKHDLEMEEFDIFLGKNYVVTSYRGPKMPAVEKFTRELKRNDRLLANGADFLCHALIDIIVDNYSDPLEMLEAELEELEEAVLARPQASTLETIFRLKHSIMSIRRVVAPEREVINHLTREEYTLIDRQSQMYFRDIYDHLVRIYDWVDILRDMATNAVEIYLNATSMRLNEIMKALTIVSTIFLPLAFVAGVYGMNFRYFPEINWKWGYAFVWGIFLLITGGMLYYFRRRKWF